MTEMQSRPSRLYKALQIKDEGRANLAILFVFRTCFHTLLLSLQIVLQFSGNLPFPFLDKNIRVSI